jgi:hypothetical protein
VPRNGINVESFCRKVAMIGHPANLVERNGVVAMYGQIVDF